MIVILLIHALTGALAIACGARLGRRALALGVVGPVATLVWLAAHAARVLEGEEFTEHVSWVPALHLGLDFRLDGFSALFASVIAGIGVVIFAFAARYLPSAGPRVGRLAGLLALFAGSMLGLVLADNVIVLYGFWELTSITSYLLIGNEHNEPRARAAALQALLITGLGGLALLGGFVLIAQAAGTYQLSEILAAPPTGTVVSVGLMLVLLGAFTKSAQYPFHSWLPGAMVAPTPVSAYLHSATMVKAGVYLIARLAPAFVVLGWWRPLVAGVGVFTMIAGGLRAVRQYDLKLILAFGTISQLGFMIVLFGLGTPETIAAGCEVVIAHALFKAALFLVVGIVEHETGTRDIRRLHRLGPGWRVVEGITVISAASMAGVPLVLGFIAKEEAFTALDHTGFAREGLLLAGVVVGSALTMAYALRFVWSLLRPAPTRAAETPAPIPSALLVAPAALLAVASIVFGVVPATLDGLISAAAQALDAATADVHLSLWHGPTLALGLSVVVTIVGLALFLARERVDSVLAAGARLPSGNDVYVASLRGLNAGADRVTAVAQSGSLPIYAGVILATAAVLTTTALLAGGGWPGWPEWIDSVAHIPVVVVLVTTAVGASAVRRRFSAALFLGAVGYAMAALFVVQGAPDLALTQVAIETLTTVLFVLVLRRLPDRFENVQTRVRRAIRVVIASGVGVMVFLMAIAAAGSRTAPPVSDEMVERAVPDGEGRNVVNVILVDFRGLDTLGEITVLATAAIGTVALARAGRRPATEGEPVGGTVEEEEVPV